jgi:AcrR family transcriptional regulator
MGIAERKEREKQQRRNDIIDAAEKVFFQKGFMQATMDAVAEQAELSKGTLYLYFKSKEELHWAISTRGVNILQDMMEKVYSARENGLENLIKLGQTFITFSEQHKKYFEALLFFEGSDLNKLNMPSEQIENTFFFESPLKLLFQAVEKGIGDGSIRGDIPVNTLASTLWAQIFGVLQVNFHKKEIFDLYKMSKQDIVQCHFNLLIDGIKKQ